MQIPQESQNPEVISESEVPEKEAEWHLIKGNREEWMG